MRGAPDTALAVDYRELRTRCAARAVARDVISVTGPEARSYLQGQCSQDVGEFGPGDVADSFLLAPEGKLVALLRVLCVGDDAFLLDVDGGYADAVLSRLQRFKLRAKVTVAELGWRVIGVRGPEAAAVFNAEVGEVGRSVEPGPARAGAAASGDHWVVPVSWGGVEGVDLLGPEPATLVPSGMAWAAAAAWEALRIEAGIPVMGRELDDATIPAETGLLSRTVSFTKGCYTGQELVARMDARGNRTPRHLVGFVVDSATAVSPAELEGATVVLADGAKPAGRVTSAAWCPGAGGPAALGYAHRSVDVPGPVVLRVGDEKGPTVAARAVELPIVGGTHESPGTQAGRLQ